MDRSKIPNASQRKAPGNEVGRNISVPKIAQRVTKAIHKMTHQECEFSLHGWNCWKTVGLSENQATRKEDLLVAEIRMLHILLFHILCSS